MDKPELVVETRFEVDDDGIRRLVEESTRPDPARDGRSAYLRIRKSRPIRHGEAPEQVAAASKAFAEDAAKLANRACGSGPDGARFTRLFSDFNDGSSFFESKWFTREDVERARRVFDAPQER